LAVRMREYFDAQLSWEEYKTRQTALTENAARFVAKDARDKAIRADSFKKDRLRRYVLRPFDIRWCYYTPVRPVWNEPRPALWAQCWSTNLFLMTRPKGVAVPEGVPFSLTGAVGDNDAFRGHAYYFPLRLMNGQRLSHTQHATLFDALGTEPQQNSPLANLSGEARDYLHSLGIENPDSDAQAAGLIWMHALVIGYSPAYLTENADGIRRDWPRIPLPATRRALETSGVLGEQIAALLDAEVDVSGVTSGRITAALKSIGRVMQVGGGGPDMTSADLAVTVGWGRAGKGGVTMPGRGKVLDRKYSDEEMKAIETETTARGMSVKDAIRLLGAKTYDVYLNDVAYWRNIPANVWEYRIGGYQVIKKWLSYREAKLLGRALKADEAREVTNMARRIAAIILLQPKLDENYRTIKESCFEWSSAQE
jgi:hypothetical protein